MGQQSGEEKEALLKEMNLLWDKSEYAGLSDKHEKKQLTTIPIIDEKSLRAWIKQYWEYAEPDGAMQTQWCQGLVIEVKSADRLDISWNEKHLCEGDPAKTKQTLMKLKWTKHIAQRLNLGDSSE